MMKARGVNSRFDDSPIMPVLMIGELLAKATFRPPKCLLLRSPGGGGGVGQWGNREKQRVAKVLIKCGPHELFECLKYEVQRQIS